MDRTVLVVEDDARIAEVIAEQLGEEGFTVCLARSVSQALALLSERAPDLAVLDVGLPDGSGFEICRRIREGGERFDSAIPVLMLSGRTDEVDVLRGFQRGADDYVRKPFSVPELMARIDVLMSRGRRRASGVGRSPWPICPIIFQLRCSFDYSTSVAGFPVWCLCCRPKWPIASWQNPAAPTMVCSRSWRSASGSPGS